MIREKGTPVSHAGHGTDGFTLLELAIVLVLIGIILAGGLVTFGAYLQANQFNSTVARMDKIEKALLNFAVAFGRIPCPSDLTLTASSPYYGMEAGGGSGSAIGVGTGACTGAGMVPQATFTASNGVVEGGIPTRALQLPDSDMYDGWGRRFSYAVDPMATITDALPIQAGTPWCGDPITINDASGNPRSTRAIYAIISHGADGHGAYTNAGVMMNSDSDNANELTNCHCTSAGVPDATYTPTYVEMLPTTDPSDQYDNFDDIVTFKEAWQMQRPNFPLRTTPRSSAGECIYVTTWQYTTSAKLVQEYNRNGQYVDGFGTFNNVQALDGTFIFTTGDDVDQNGDVWAVDYGGSRVEKFTGDGTWIGSLGQVPGGACTDCLCMSACSTSPYSGSYDGKFAGGGVNSPSDVAVDSSGNVWVVDNGNNRVEEFSSSGVFENTFGTYGVANGQFDSPGGVAIDASGDVWVTDGGNQRVEEFSSGGAWMQTIPSSGCTGSSPPACAAGSSSGQFNRPGGIAIDSSGNVWVSDYNNDRIQEFSSNGVYLGQLGCASGACPWSSTNGALMGPENLKFDVDGNLWVATWGNQRVAEFSSTGTWLQNFSIPNPVGIAISGR